MNPKFRGGGSSQDTDEVVISGGGDGVQTNETQTDETLPEVQNKEANQASEEMQKGKESLELPKNKASETEEDMELLSVGRGSLTGDISSIVKMRLNDLYLEGENGKKYIIQGGDKPKNSQEQLSELKVGETLHLDYKWDIIYDTAQGINQIQYIKQGNYFQVELPDYKVFNNFELSSQEVRVKKDGTNTTFKLGEYSIVDTGSDRYLRLTMTEENDYYQENVLASITGGHPQLTFKVRKVSDEQTIHIPGLDENVSADVAITIVQDSPNGGGGNTQPKPKPNPIPEDNGGYKDPPGPLKKESGQNKWVGRDRIRWWLHINRDAAYDMFSNGFNSSANPRKNLVVTDDISTMTSDNSNATFKLDSDSVIIYLDMLKPIIKDGQVTGFSHGPVFTRWIYKNDGSLSRLDSYFDSKVVVDNNKLEVQFGDIPNTNNTYRKAFEDSDESIEILKKFLEDPVINNQAVDTDGNIIPNQEPTDEEYWKKVDEYKEELKTTGGKDFTDLMIDKVTAGKITVNQAKIMKKTYWDSKMPIMHYTVQFDTEFRGMQVGDKASNTAYLKSDEIKESYTDDQIINEVYLTDNPVTRSPKVNIVINKEWQDASGKAMDDAPIDKISVQLYQDNKAYGSSVKIGKDNNWTYTFKDLPGYKSQGVLYEYTVKELTNINGYGSEIKVDDKGNSITFTITNKQLPPTVPPTTPPTPPTNPYIPPYIPPTPDIIIPPTPTPLTPPDVPDEEIILPDEDVIIDDDDVVKTDFDEEDEVMEDDVPLANIPKTGAFHSLLPLVGISLLSLIMLFKFRPKK